MNDVDGTAYPCCGARLDEDEAGAARLAVFRRERPHLLAVAFRILGSHADAEDVVQEAWIRYAGAHTRGVGNVPAWLTTVVARLCLDLLRRRRDVPAMPEESEAPVGDGPEELAVLAGELTRALTVVLDELPPPQRVAFVLHDVFGVPFDEIAAILGTTAGYAKKLASHARRRVRPPNAAPRTDPRETRRVVAAFLVAARQGDVAGLVAVLDPTVVRTADPQVLPPGTSQRVQGARAVIRETRALRENARRARLAVAGGRPVIVLPAEDGGARAVLVFRVAGGRITHFDVVADPQRLALLHVEG